MIAGGRSRCIPLLGRPRLQAALRELVHLSRSPPASQSGDQTSAGLQVLASRVEARLERAHRLLLLLQRRRRCSQLELSIVQQVPELLLPAHGR